MLFCDSSGTNILEQLFYNVLISERPHVCSDGLEGDFPLKDHTMSVIPDDAPRRSPGTVLQLNFETNLLFI